MDRFHGNGGRGGRGRGRGRGRGGGRSGRMGGRGFHTPPQQQSMHYSNASSSNNNNNNNNGYRYNGNNNEFYGQSSVPPFHPNASHHQPFNPAYQPPAQAYAPPQPANPYQPSSNHFQYEEDSGYQRQRSPYIRDQRQQPQFSANQGGAYGGTLPPPLPSTKEPNYDAPQPRPPPSNNYHAANHKRQQMYAPVGQSDGSLYNSQPQQHYQPPLPLSGPINNGYQQHYHPQPQQQAYAPPPQQFQHQSYPASTLHQQPYSSRPPPPTYCCHKCGQPGHWIQDCTIPSNNQQRNGRSLGHQRMNQQPPLQQPQYSAHSAARHQHHPPLPSDHPPPLPPSFDNSQDDYQEDERGDYAWEVNEDIQQQQHLYQSPGGVLGSAPTSPHPPLPPLPPGPMSSETKPWVCEPCEKSFVMESQFHAHMKTHVACSAPDCDFSASKRVVGAHFQTAHGQYAGNGLKEIDVEGQKFMVLVGNSPEDIAKWRAERRRKWPSAANKTSPAPRQSVVPLPVTKKRKLSRDEDEELEEGEVEESSAAASNAEDEEEESVQVQNDESAACAMAIEEPVEEEVTSTSSISQEPPAKKQKRTMLCKKFLHNQCRFGDNCKFSHDRKAFMCRALVQKGKCSKGDQCAFSHDPQLRVEQEAKRENEKVEAKWRTENKSLLRKLLKKDIMAEQQKLLQIVHFLVENNFLQNKNDSSMP